MAKAKSKIWTICYILSDLGDDPAEPFTATWFAYGKDKADARAKFLADFHSHPEDFYGSTEETQITISHVVEGFTC